MFMTTRKKNRSRKTIGDNKVVVKMIINTQYTVACR